MGKLWRRAAVCAACLAFLGGGLPAHAQQEPLPAAAGGILPEQGQLPLLWAGNDGLEYSFEITQPGTWSGPCWLGRPCRMRRATRSGAPIPRRTSAITSCLAGRAQPTGRGWRSCRQGG